MKISMKSSNTQVMVQAYRLLAQKLNEGGFKAYPLHLGVTEAGEAEDGRIKSAVGIGTLLEDGLGDTVRVSLTEDPEFEAPVAKALIDRYTNRQHHDPIRPISHYPIHPFDHAKRVTHEIYNFGDHNVPRVITDISRIESITPKEMKQVGHFYLPELDKWKMNDQGCDFVYSGKNPIPFMLPNGMKEIQDLEVWKVSSDRGNKFPLFNLIEYQNSTESHPELNFLEIDDTEIESAIPLIHDRKNTLLILKTSNTHSMPALRRAMVSLMHADLQIPVVLKVSYPDQTADETMLYAATDVGGLLIDGLGDGIFISLEKEKSHTREEVLSQIKLHNATGFGVLQAARTRMSKTEYISCPSCGRTLFDLQETTAMIRKRTDHLKGVKIGIMGCIVNGPGEMADADFGYVGSGKGKITLYRGKDVVKRSVPSERAVDELIKIIKTSGMWNEPEEM
jgi:(E)-4-hydroxy-3-methylbut-2-enyl-diphosphate synthase